MTASAWSPNAAVVPQVNAAGLIKMEYIQAADSQRLFSIQSFAYTVNTGSLLVFKNGKILVRNVDYTEADGTSFILTAAAAAGDVILAVAMVGITSTVGVDAVLRTDIGAAGGSSIVGFLMAAGLVQRTATDKLQELEISLFEFIPKAQQAAIINKTSVYDASDDIIRAIAYCNALADGTKLYAPKGKYRCNKAITFKNKVTLRGTTKTSTIFEFVHTGSGFVAVNPLNASTAAYIDITDCSIVNTNAANTGGGYDDTGSTFVNLHKVYFSGWKNDVIFDQTEIATIDLCEFLQPAAGNAIWLVNGNAHANGANKGFTNRITITRNQFNAGVGAGTNIVLDGGGNFSIRDNNFNAGSLALRAAGAAGLIFEGNETEGHTTTTIILTDTTSTGDYVGPCLAPKISGNTITDNGVPSHIQIDDCQGGSIDCNLFGQAAGQNIIFNNGASNKSTGLTIEKNSKLVSGIYRQAAPFVAGFSQPYRANFIKQTAVTYSVAATAAGAVTVTPATMESIRINTRLWCINPDGTNGEQVFVTATAAGTFSASFATPKSANFLIYGLASGTDEEGSWTPTIFGTGTAGANTYSVQAGFYSRRGNTVFVTAHVTINAKDVTMAGQLHIGGLPFTPAPIAGSAQAVATLCVDGWTAAGYTQASGGINAGTKDISILITGSGVPLNVLTAAQITGTLSVIVTGTYITNDL